MALAESRDILSQENIPENATPDPEIQYALQFLTYAYGVPFRLTALQQELSDVFGFTGAFDSGFLSRWDVLTPPERAAFCQSYREFRRMESLRHKFELVDQETENVGTLEERASRFVAAHMDGLDDWHETLRREANALPGSAATTMIFTGVEPVAAPAQIDSDRTGQALLEGLATRDSNDVSSILESLAPMDDLARQVLQEMCTAEIGEAQGRFLARVRWMLSLPTQQRMAIALRSIGKKRREIAKAMGISEESVKTHLARADDDWDKLPETSKSVSARARGKSGRKRHSAGDVPPVPRTA